jgi:hypothetical protein
MESESSPSTSLDHKEAILEQFKHANEAKGLYDLYPTYGCGPGG